jgi:hypothetical protein
MKMVVIGNTIGYGYQEGLYVCCICKSRSEWTDNIQKALVFTEETARRIIQRKRCVKLIEVTVEGRP